MSVVNWAEMQGWAVRTHSQQLGDGASCLVGSRPVGKLPARICAQTTPTGPGAVWDTAFVMGVPGLRIAWVVELKRSPTLTVGGSAR